MNLIDSAAPLSEADLEAFAARFNHKVPAALLGFHRRCNGGYLREEGEETDPSEVDYMTPISHGDDTIEDGYATLSKGFPHLAGYLPFADDAYGNTFLVSMQDHDHGRVVLHLLDGDELLDIDDSFEAFIAGIESRLDGAR